jgi:hypothetical protein
VHRCTGKKTEICSGALGENAQDCDVDIDIWPGALLSALGALHK